MKHEAQPDLRECEMTLDVRGAEDDAERESRDYARSRREAEVGVYIAHGPTDGVHG